MIGLILAAAGSGVRVGTPVPKQFLEYRDRPLYQHSLDCFDEFCSDLVIVVPEGWEARIRGEVRRCRLRSRVRVTTGGANRQDSVHRGLLELPLGPEIVLVHDAVRPHTTTALISRVIDGARSHGACVPGVPVVETVKEVHVDDRVERTLNRERLRSIQTPQGFRREVLLQALQEASHSGFVGTDEATLVERLGHPVFVVPGDPSNFKVTWREDLERAASPERRKSR